MMIPTIGLMIGIYTTIRLLVLSWRNGEMVLTRIFAVLGALAILALSLALLASGTNIPIP